MTPKHTRQVYRRHGHSYPQTLELSSEEISLTQPSSLLVRVHAVALNYRDANILHGTNPWPVSPSGIPCSDAAGTVIAVGPSVAHLKIGDRVCPIFDQLSITGQEQRRLWLGGEVDGVLASHLVVDQEHVVRIPDHLSWSEAACLPCAGLTAWSALAVGGEIRAGNTVLIQGTGGVSVMAVKLARAAGCKVILTSSSDAKLEAVKNIEGIGHIDTINYKNLLDWDVEALRINGGHGVDIVLENGGTSSLLRSINATAKRGIVSQVGYLGQQDSAHLGGLLSILIDKSITLRGINVGSRLEFEKLNKLVSANILRFDDVIDRKFAFHDAANAFEYLWSGKQVGKIVVELP